MEHNCCVIIMICLVFIPFGRGSWGEPGNGQYHIQTDEGPERYFRFQTDNGQFRKEKRLQDGTVIGTEAWIDAAGVLRQKDYIADKQGYRVLKSKTIFVGQGRKIEDAIKSTKSSVTSQGHHAHVNSIVHVNDAKRIERVYSTTPFPPRSTIATSTLEPIRARYLPPSEAAKIEPSPYLGFDHYPDEYIHSHSHSHTQQGPIVQLRHHSQPIEDDINSIASDVIHNDVSSSTTQASVVYGPSTPSLSMQPPLENNYRRIRPIAILSSTPTPIRVEDSVPEPIGAAGSIYHNDALGYSTPAPFTAPEGGISTHDGYHYGPTSTPSYVAKYENDPEESYASTTSRTPNVLPIDVNSLEGLLPPPLPANRNKLRLRPQVQSHSSITPSGFHYLLPHQYHEEEQIDEHTRAGSYGYVDPFGIRRVVYYNAGPERGFVHRNSNRYVGFNAAPYDPITV